MVDQGDDEKKFNAVCNLMRRLPPNQFEKCLAGFFEFIEDEDLQSRIVESIDMPLGKPHTSIAILCRNHETG